MSTWNHGRRGRHFAPGTPARPRVPSVAAGALVGLLSVVPAMVVVPLTASASPTDTTGTTSTSTTSTTAGGLSPSTTSTTVAPSTTTTTVAPTTTTPSSATTSTTAAPTTTTTVPATTTTTAGVTPVVPGTSQWGVSTRGRYTPPGHDAKARQAHNVAPTIAPPGQGVIGPVPTPVVPVAIPAAPLPVLRRVLVVTDHRSDAPVAAMTRLLRQAGVSVHTFDSPLRTYAVRGWRLVDPSYGTTGLRTVPHVLRRDVVVSHRSLAAKRIDARIHGWHPQVVVLAAPSSYTRQVDALLAGLPAHQRVLWAQDVTARTIGRASLPRTDARLLGRWGHLSIATPGVFLAPQLLTDAALHPAAAHLAAFTAQTSGTAAGVHPLVAGAGRTLRLTKAGTRTYAQSVLDLVDAAWRLPELPSGLGLSSDSAGLVAVAAAESRIGDPYVWGGAGPSVFDCSGLVMWAYAHAGITLPHYSGDQFLDTVPVSMDALEPGDLLFPADPGQHVAMYVGGGQIIQAPHTGAAVQVVPLADTGNFFQYAGRVVTNQTVGTAVGQESISTVQAYAYEQVQATTGWGAAQWPYLDLLWQRESGWRVDALNPISGAYGIPQALPGLKMAATSADWLTNPQTQVDWGLAYIARTYGTPEVAWQHETLFGWY